MDVVKLASNLLSSVLYISQELASFNDDNDYDDGGDDSDCYFRDLHCLFSFYLKFRSFQVIYQIAYFNENKTGLSKRTLMTDGANIKENKVS